MKKIDPNKFNLIVDLYKSNQLNKAESLTKEMILKYPDESILHNLLGAIFIEKKELNKAITCFEKTIEIKPDFAEAYNNLGKVYYEQKKTILR